MDYKKIITNKTYKDFAFTNEDLLSSSPKGIVLIIRACNDLTLYTSHFQFEYRYAKEGIISIIPNTNPWCFLNDIAVNTIDAILDVLEEKYGRLPIALTGTSMGGYGCLMFSFLSRHKNSFCCVSIDSPCCDLVKIKDLHSDFNRIFLSAYGNENIDYIKSLELHSPNYNVEKLPNIPYYICSGDRDMCIVKSDNSDVLVKKMRERNLNVIYREVFGMAHSEIPPENLVEHYNFVINNIFRK